VHRQFVLARARWNLEAADIEPIRKASGAARQRRLRELRERLGIPRTVVMADDDNELVLDLENVLAVDAFVERARGGAVLAEWLVGDGFCKGPEGEFAHEIVVPFVRRKATTAASVHRGPAPRALSTASTPLAHRPKVSRRDRSFAPGSEWLYAKLYGGEASLDLVLVDAVEPLRRFALDTGAADGWFFLRYADPDSHLRVRFHGDARRLTAEIWPELERRLEPWLATRALHRIELGTYEREIERYGGLDGVRVSERLFQVDSEAALAIVSATLGESGGDARWRAALLGMHGLYAAFDDDLERRAALTTKLRDGFAKEFRADAALKDALRLRVRAERARLSALLQNRAGGASDSGALDELGDVGELPADSELQRIFAVRQRALEPLVEELRALEHHDELTCSVMDLVPSYAHVFTNRVLRSAARAHEYVMYELLSAHYRSCVGRARARERSGVAP
jgi:thiopeptide-type bacteriocin biosynthesis protein